MKFIFYLEVSSDTVEKIRIQTPCNGYLTNVSMQAHVAEGTIEDSTRHLLYMGRSLDPTVIDLIAKADAEFKTMPDIKSNGCLLTWTQALIEAEGGSATDTTPLYFYHFGKRKIWVDTDSLLYIYAYGFQASPATEKFMIQGDFIPKRGSIYQKMFGPVSFSTASNWGDIYVFDTYLKNVQIEVTVHTKYVDQDHSGRIYYRHFRRGSVNDADTFSNVVGDVFDEDMVSKEVVSMGGIIGSIKFDSAATGTKIKSFTGILTIPSVAPGDYIAWDTDDSVGSQTNNVYSKTFHIAGLVARQEYVKGGDFLVSDWHINMNDPEYSEVVEFYG
jgi:hypothetical protein